MDGDRIPDSTEQIALLELRSGNLKTTLHIPSTPQSGYLDEYVVLGLSGERLLLGSNEGDLSWLPHREASSGTIPG